MRALPLVLLVLTACGAKAGETAKSASAPGDSVPATADAGKPPKPGEAAQAAPGADGFTGAVPGAASGEAGKPQYSDLPNVPDDQLPEIRPLAEGETSGLAEIQPLRPNKP